MSAIALPTMPRPCEAETHFEEGEGSSAFLASLEPSPRCRELLETLDTLLTPSEMPPPPH